LRQYCDTATPEFRPESKRQCQHSDRDSSGAERRARNSKRDSATSDDYITSSKRTSRRRTCAPKRTYARVNDKSIQRVEGYCQCGERVEAPYSECCEDCFADNARRWNGKDRSATLLF
jgi:hypothetical protein